MEPSSVVVVHRVQMVRVEVVEQLEPQVHLEQADKMEHFLEVVVLLEHLEPAVVVAHLVLLELVVLQVHLVHLELMVLMDKLVLMVHQVVVV